MSTEHDQIFNPSDRMLRQFAALLIVFLGVIAVRTYDPQHPAPALLAAALGLVLGSVGLVWPRAIRPVFAVWMKAAWPVGWLVSRVILALIFYVIVTPVAVVFRAAHRDALGLRRRGGGVTYWQRKPAVTDKSRYLGQF
jgi:cytosine/uracil/thiamine/allantoin permease